MIITPEYRIVTDLDRGSGDTRSGIIRALFLRRDPEFALGNQKFLP